MGLNSSWSIEYADSCRLGGVNVGDITISGGSSTPVSSSAANSVAISTAANTNFPAAATTTGAAVVTTTNATPTGGLAGTTPNSASVNLVGTLSMVMTAGVAAFIAL